MTGGADARPAAGAAADWHLRDADALAREHGVSPELGLHEHEVTQRFQLHGANALPASGEKHGSRVKPEMTAP